MRADSRINRQARKQHGLITRAQALRLGASPRAIEGKLTSGLWSPVRVGVYAIDGSPRSWEQAVLAACLVAEGSTWASHGTAAKLWQLDGAPATDELHVVRPLGRYARQPGVVCHRSKLLHPKDLSVHRAVPVTSVARTIIELSGSLGPERTGRMLDDAMRRSRGELEAVRASVARLAGPGRRRLSVIRAVLSQRLPGYDPGDSDLEVRALRALVAAGLGWPSQQHAVRAGGRRYRIDLAYEALRIGIELKGWGPHGTRSAFDADPLRANELAIAGWTIVEFTSSHDDQVLVDQVGRLLQARAA